jgi:hypothetical protein
MEASFLWMSPKVLATFFGFWLQTGNESTIRLLSYDFTTFSGITGTLPHHKISA